MYIILTINWLAVLSCSCAFADIQTELTRSDFIATIEVLQIKSFTDDTLVPLDDGTEELWPGYDGYFTRVTELFKGEESTSTFWLLSSRDGCGTHLEVGKSYLLFAKEIDLEFSSDGLDSSRYYTGRCYRTKQLETTQAQMDLAVIRKGN